MKNFIIFILLLASLIAGYFAVQSRLVISTSRRTGKTEKIIRGDLTLPINATGEVRPARRVELKSEASGEVIEISRKPGDRVSAGDLLIRLKRTEEQRNVDKSELDVKSGMAKLEDARVRLELAKGPELAAAKASLDQTKETLRLTKFRKEKLDSLDPSQTNEEERLARDVAYQQDIASVQQAEANLKKAELAIPLAEQAVASAEAALDRVKTVLQDAQERLEDTDIVAPIDGIVGSVQVEIGDVIQGGKTNFTGGTVLATVLDMGTLRVGAEVDESDIESVRELAPPWAIPGRERAATMPDDFVAAAEGKEHLPIINVESFQGEDFIGMIELINPEPRTASGVVTYMVDVIIVSDNRDLLLPGMRADVRFTSQHVENVLLCPNEAIREGPNTELGVYVPDDDPSTTDVETAFKACTFGISNGRYSEVTCDVLNEGDVVFTQLPVVRNDD